MLKVYDPEPPEGSLLKARYAATARAAAPSIFDTRAHTAGRQTKSLKNSADVLVRNKPKKPNSVNEKRSTQEGAIASK